MTDHHVPCLSVGGGLESRCEAPASFRRGQVTPHPHSIGTALRFCLGGRCPWQTSALTARLCLTLVGLHLVCALFPPPPLV